jgi:putative YhdH/YhfP family quinone oxidoreductase
MRAFRIHDDAKSHRSGLETLATPEPQPGEARVRVAWSSINYKDALAATGKGRILRRTPLVGGIDLAGHVEASRDPRWREGDAVLATGGGLSETRDGGYADYACVPGDDLIAVPPALDLRDAMALGTAGFTAALALLRMEENHQHPALGPLLVTGASGGVGSLAVMVFRQAGYRVIAVSGRPQHAEWLRSLGADDVWPREALQAASRPLDSVRFAGALDTVGGSSLAALLAATAPCGNVATCGLVADSAFASTVMPFILRGVSLLGVASAGAPRVQREVVWQRLAGAWKPPDLSRIVTREVTLDALPQAFGLFIAGQATGRTVVRIAD